MGRSLTTKENAFCIAIAKNGESEKVKSYTEAGYSTNMSAKAISVQADKIFNKPKINLEIKRLQIISSKIAEDKFNITIEQRLTWLKEIVEAGLSTYQDKNGESRREGLSASKGAIETINNMLGVSDDEDDTGEALTINFSVNSAVKNVRVIKGE